MNNDNGLSTNVYFITTGPLRVYIAKLLEFVLLLTLV